MATMRDTKGHSIFDVIEDDINTTLKNEGLENPSNTKGVGEQSVLRMLLSTNPNIEPANMDIDSCRYVKMLYKDFEWKKCPENIKVDTANTVDINVANYIDDKLVYLKSALSSADIDKNEDFLEAWEVKDAVPMTEIEKIYCANKCLF